MGDTINWQKCAVLIVGAALAASGITSVQARAVTAEKVKIKHVVLNAGNVGRTLSSGYTTINSQEVWCAYNCTLAMSVMANVGDATCKDEWAIVEAVDGYSVDGSPLLEPLPNAGNTQTHTWQGVYNTTTGYHSVTFQLYLPCSANANQWSVRYLITVP